MLSDAMMRPLSLGRPAKYCQFGQIKLFFFFFYFHNFNFNEVKQYSR